MHKITVDKPNNHIGGLRLRLECTSKPCLYISVISESASYRKHDSQNRDNGQECRISKCGGMVHHTLRREKTYSDHQFLDNVIKEISQWWNITCWYLPDVNFKKSHQIHQLLFHAQNQEISTFKIKKALPL